MDVLVCLCMHMGRYVYVNIQLYFTICLLRGSGHNDISVAMKTTHTHFLLFQYRSPLVETRDPGSDDQLLSLDKIKA